MKLKNIFMFLILLSVCISIYRCNTIQPTTSSIYVDIDSKEKVSFFDVFSKIEITPFETNDTCLVGSVDKLILRDSIYYLLDKKQNSIFIFNQDGKFIQNIKRVGRGLGEYLYVYDFVINEYNHTLELLDPFGKLIILNLDGSYKASVNLPHPPLAYHKLTLLNQDTILFFNSDNDVNANLIWAYSRASGKIIKEFYKDSQSDFVKKLPLYSWNNIVYLSMPLENTIFKIENLEAIPVYSWDFGKYNYKFQTKDIPKENEEKAKFYEAVGTSFPITYTHVLNLQNDQYLYCFIIHFDQRKHIFYDKKTKKSWVLGNTKEPVSLNPYSMDNETMLGIEYPDSETYKQMIEANIIDSNNRTQISSVVEDSNPVIVKYTFKD